jgi:hypothetical protein
MCVGEGERETVKDVGHRGHNDTAGPILSSC